MKSPRTLPTVYLCDDEPSVLDGLAFLLKQQGFLVSAHGSGPALLEAIQKIPTPLRGIFVLDLDMAPMRGVELHDALRALGLGPKNPVIFLSGKGTLGIAVEEMKKGALDFVEKPHTVDKLVPLIHRALELEDQWQTAARRQVFLAELWHSLSQQQKRVALKKAAGDLNKVIAAALGISDRMVEEHLKKAMEKLGVESHAALATTINETRASRTSMIVEDVAKES